MGSFSQDVTKFVEKTKIKADIVVRKLAFEALRSVVVRTPVDTGRCRGNWRVAINQIDKTVEEYAGTQEASAQKSISAGTITANSAKVGDTIWITNNVDYARFLEAGSSKQAPSGMLKITFEELKAYLTKLVKAAGG